MSAAAATGAAADRRALRRALQLAARPRGATHPNPMVGAVLQRDGVTVGEGFHRVAGGPHAEVGALRAAGDLARGATLYVTLEPCNHHGRTPPCVAAIVAAGVRRVVVGMADPNPAVRGGGVAALRAAGLDVTLGLLEDECRALNSDWLHWLRTGRPELSLKLASTLDGWLAASSGDAAWISGEASRREVQRLRARADAVLVGAGTLRADDPRLGARLRGARQPWRIALDPRLECPAHARILTTPGGPALLVAAQDAPQEREAALRAAGAEVLRVPRRADGRLDLDALLTALGQRGLLSLLVEGGGELARELLEAELVDRALIFVAPRILGGRDGVPLAGRAPGAPQVAAGWQLEGVQQRRFGDDVLFSGRPRRPARGS